MATPTTVRQRLGGPNAVTWPGFWILLVAGSIVVLAGSVESPLSRIGPQLVIATAATCATYGLLWLARLSVLRSSSTLRPQPWRTLICYIVATLLGTIAASVVAAGLHLGSTSPPPAGTPPWLPLVASLATLISVVITLVAGAVVVDAWREYRTRDAHIHDLMARLDHCRTEALLDVEAQDALVRRSVESILLGEIERLDSGDVAAVAQELKTAALDVVRPLSHGLIDVAIDLPSMSSPKVRLSVDRVIRDATRERLVRPLWFTVLVCVPVGFFSALTLGPASGLRLVVLTAVVLVIVSAIGNAVLRSRQHFTLAGRALLWLAVVIGAMVVTLAMWLLVVPDTRNVTAWLVLSLLIPLAALAVTAVAAGSGVYQRQREEEGSLETALAWHEARVREFSHVRRTTTARALHGPVQSAALACAMRLHAAVADGGIDNLVIEDVRALLADAVVGLADPAATPLDFHDVLARITVMWEGVCHIAITVDEAASRALHDDPVSSEAAADVVTEACSNAVRHGAATQITIDVSLSAPGELTLLVEDNGTTSNVDPNPGLGTHLLDSVSLRWGRARDNERTTLSVTLPLSPHPLSH